MTAADAAFVAAHLRAADADEIAAAGLRTPEQSLQAGYERSLEAYTARVEGEIACVFGLVPDSLTGGSAAIWMLGTPVLDKNPRALMRLTPAYITHFQALYPFLANMVDARNVRTIRWLKRLGFTFMDEAPYGAHGAMFRPFYKYRS